MDLSLHRYMRVCDSLEARKMLQDMQTDDIVAYTIPILAELTGVVVLRMAILVVCCECYIELLPELATSPWRPLDFAEGQQGLGRASLVSEG